MKRFFLGSLLLHLSILLVSPNVTNDSPSTEVDFISARPQPNFHILPYPFPFPEFNQPNELKAAENESNLPPTARKDFKYKSYLDRIYSTVGPLWTRLIRIKLGKSKVRRDYKTVLWIIVDSKGKTTKTMLVSSSGKSDYDQIAIDSMKDQYFPNPPKELIDSDGYGRVLWSFVIYQDETL